MKKLLLGAMALLSFYANAQLAVEHFDADWTGFPAAPPGWIVINEFGPVQTWKQTVSGNVSEPPYGVTGHAAYLDKENVAPGDATPSDWLVTPSFNMQENLQINFQSRLTINGDQGSIYKVYLMPAFLAPTVANFISNPAYLIVSYTELEINPVQTEWTQKVINVPSNNLWPAGIPMRIALVMTGDDGDRWFIDDFGISNACLAPTNLTASFNTTSAVLGWTENGFATSWEVELLSATDIPSGVGSVATANPVVFSALSNGTVFTPDGEYKYYVRSACSDGGLSVWAGPYFFPNSDCPAPTNIVITTLNPVSVTYAWTATGALYYDYYITTSDVSPSGVTAPTGTAFSSEATINGLTTGLDYKFYVRSHCAGGSVSPWSGFPEIVAPVDNNIFTGKVTYDADGDGVCDVNAAGIPYVEVQVSVNGEAPFSVYTNEEGEYNLYTIEDGTTSLSLQVIAPNLFVPAAPLVQEVTFSETIDALSVTHCLAQPTVGNDLSVTLIPVTPARPGLPAIYRIIAHNAGSTVLNNVVLNVAFNDARLNYFNSEYANTVVTEGNLAINLGTMQPFSVQNGNITFNVLIPPVNVGGENLSFTASISDVDDLTPDDNTSVLNQIIVNSYDPNDITVHEGAEIYEEQANDYLTYTIRFQNTGTADAIDIKLTNTLDELLDWGTFKPVVSSHSYTVTRTDDLLEFDYKNIYLADSNSNEPASHGYITYKIKPKTGFSVGEIVSNTAEIFFDFNEAIVTNTATTTVVALAGLNNNALVIAKLYPNPVKDQLHVEVAQGELQLVTIHDVNGRLCLSANAGVIDTNGLTSGIYFVKITTDAGSANYKIIKQ